MREKIEKGLTVIRKEGREGMNDGCWWISSEGEGQILNEVEVKNDDHGEISTKKEMILEEDLELYICFMARMEPHTSLRGPWPTKLGDFVHFSLIFSF